MSEEKLTRAASSPAGAGASAGLSVLRWQSRAAMWWSTTATVRPLPPRLPHCAKSLASRPSPCRPTSPLPRGCKKLFEEAVNAFGRVEYSRQTTRAVTLRRNLIPSLFRRQDFEAPFLERHLKGVAFLCCKEAARRMVRQRYGRIVNLSSVVGLRGNAARPTIPPARRASSA